MSSSVFHSDAARSVPEERNQNAGHHVVPSIPTDKVAALRGAHSDDATHAAGALSPAQQDPTSSSPFMDEDPDSLRIAEEMEGVTINLGIPVDEVMSLRSVFGMFDEDGSEAIDIEEMISVLR